MITKKLVLLLALASGQRCQTLVAIRVSQISFTAERVLIRVPDKELQADHSLFYPSLDSGDTTTYVLLIYFFIICHERKTFVPRPDSLFIALKRPHTAVGSQTISRWIKNALADC